MSATSEPPAKIFKVAENREEKDEEELEQTMKNISMKLKKSFPKKIQVIRNSKHF